MFSVTLLLRNSNYKASKERHISSPREGNPPHRAATPVQFTKSLFLWCTERTSWSKSKSRVFLARRGTGSGCDGKRGWSTAGRSGAPGSQPPAGSIFRGENPQVSLARKEATRMCSNINAFYEWRGNSAQPGSAGAVMHNIYTGKRGR